MKITKIITYVSILLCILAVGGFYYNQSINSHDTEVDNFELVNSTPEEEATSNPEKDTIFVHVCGAVKKPGVYEIMRDARICDAISAAGGLKKKAADTVVNQAQIVSDGEQIYIPYQYDDVTNANETSMVSNTGKVNINTATVEELTALPGVGEAKANSIIQYREEHGGFSSIEEIKNISGIKDGVYNKIESSITV